MFYVASDVDEDINVLYSGEVDYAKGWTIRGSESARTGEFSVQKFSDRVWGSTQPSILAIPGPFPQD
jgi:hypothetical protein